MMYNIFPKKTIYHILPTNRKFSTNLPPKWIYKILPLIMIPIMKPKRKGIIYLWNKVFCLFCFVLFVLMKGAWAWYYDVWTCGTKVLEYWMISSLKIKLNCSWKFQRNWNVPLILLERSWWIGLMEFI